MKRVRDVIENQMDQEGFGVPELCRAMGMGRSNLFAKIKALTNFTPLALIRLLRLKKAEELLKNTNLNISQIAFEVGFRDPAHFYRLFSKEFGVSPKNYRQEAAE